MFNPLQNRTILEMIFGGLSEPKIGTPPIFGGSMGNMTMPNQGVVNRDVAERINSPVASVGNSDWNQTLSQLKTKLNQMPQREDPSIWRRIGSQLASIGSGGPVGMWGGVPVGWQSNNKAGVDFLNAPHDRKMEDWKNEVGILSDIAGIEGDVSREDRIREDAELDRELRERGMIRQEERDAEIARNNFANQELRMEIARMQLEGREQAAQEATKRAMELEQMRQSGRIDQLQFQSMIQQELARLRGDITSDQIKLRGDVTRDTAEATQWSEPLQTFDKDGKPGQVIQTNKVTGEVRIVEAPGVIRTTSSGSGTAGGNKVLSPTQENQALRNKALNIINSNPELTKYFETDSQGRPTGKLKGPNFLSSTFGSGNEEYERAKQLMGISVQPVTSRTPAAGADKIRVKRKADGVTGTINVSDFDPTKYDRIQ
jgi:hypothetical protein